MVLILTFSSQLQKEKFEYIYESYKGLMLRKAVGILKDPLLAEDAVSEAFIRIYKNLDKIEEAASNRTIAFVVIIAKNAALTMLANETRHTFVPIEESQTDHFDLEHHVLGEISVGEITKIIDTLKDDLKDVFLLNYAYHFSHKEIAKLLNISENNVTVRMHRARKKLCELLIKGGYVHEKAQ